MLKLKKPLNGNLGLENPGAMNITVMNDDSKKIEWEKRERVFGG